MADNIMTHLETMREREDRKRSHHMNMCLAAFVDPEHQIRKRSRRSTAGSESQKQPLQAASRVANAGPGSPATNKLSANGAAGATGSARNEAEESSVHDSEAEDSGIARIDDHAHLDTFKRAADLLRDSLFLDAGGGVVFMDSTALPYLDPQDQTGASFHTSDEENDKSIFQRRGSLDSIRMKSTSTSGNLRKRAPQAGSRARPSADILAQSIVTSTSDGLQGDDAAEFAPLAAADVAKLIRRYPRGKLFALEMDEVTSPSSGEDYAYGFDVSKPKRKSPYQTEVQLLLKHFPGARQIIFLPLWDCASLRWSAFFAYNTSDFRTMTHNPDFLHCIAFCNCVMTEIARIATLAADQQKSDFIGSISHELRSPLHGILASCEFLADTDCDSFQRSLVDTADSCARTLLDTINMVLDYSKINAFERNERKARKSRRELAAMSAGTNSSMQPLLNIYGNVDLATITEEVVEGIATGQVFKDFTSADVADLAPSTACHGRSTRSNVEIILDISPRAWTFVTQPGAFRRIVMNLFGNALKYTKAGFIVSRTFPQALYLTKSCQRYGIAITQRPSN